MYVILTYDVGSKRNSKIMKTCRKYLIHVQKSVFEGDISSGKLKSLKATLSKLIDPENDQIAIYRLNQSGGMQKEVIGYHISNDNVV